jgi:hypothetical protein
MLWTSGLDPAGADWWTPGGTWYDQLNGPAFEQLVP